MDQYFKKDDSIEGRLEQELNPTSSYNTEEVKIVESTGTVEVKPTDTVVGDLLAQINSRRREYGTPNIANVGLPRPELSPINLNPATSSNLPEDNTGIDDSGESSNSPEDNIPSIN
jgi:hypothetical protein